MQKGDYMAITDAERRAYAKYKKEKRKQIVLNMSITDYERIQAYCIEHNIQTATWIKALIWDTIEGQERNQERAAIGQELDTTNYS